MTVQATYGNYEGRPVWKFRMFGQEIVPLPQRASIVSSNAVLAREAQRAADTIGVKLPSKWDLVVRR